MDIDQEGRGGDSKWQAQGTWLGKPVTPPQERPQRLPVPPRPAARDGSSAARAHNCLTPSASPAMAATAITACGSGRRCVFSGLSAARLEASSSEARTYNGLCTLLGPSLWDATDWCSRVVGPELFPFSLPEISYVDLIADVASLHSLAGVSSQQPAGHKRPRLAMNVAQRKITSLLKIAHQFLLVFVFLMCGPRQLFFFQCGPETAKGWTPLV